VDLLRAKLRDSESQKDSYHDALASLENRFERSQSAIVHEVESKGKSQEREFGPDMNEEALRKPPSPLVSGSVLSHWWEFVFMHFLHFLTLLQSSAIGTPTIPTNGYHDASSEMQVLQDQLNARDAKIAELEKETTVLRDEKTTMQLEVSIF
jgi:E3 ubiquitin-protein ligase BRE1